MKKVKLKRFRLIVQLGFLFIVIVAAFNHYLGTIGKAIPWVSESTFHYICPICGVTSIYQFLTSSTIWILKLKSTLGIVIAISLILTMILGPVICGFICPFGTIQDLLARVGKKIFKRKYNKFIPEKIDSKLKYLRYVSLIVTIILTATSSVTVLEAINPYHGFLSLFNRKFSITAFVVLGFIVITSLFVQRPWCRYLCPYGAFLGLFNKVKVFRIIRKESTCISCKKCSKECPVGIKVNEEKEVRNLSCISCMECVDEKVCPKSGTIYLTAEDDENKESKNKINN